MAIATNDSDPRAILAALERNYVDFILIGTIARVLSEGGGRIDAGSCSTRAALVPRT